MYVLPTELQKKGSKLVNFLILIPKGDTPMSEESTQQSGLGGASTDITKSKNVFGVHRRSLKIE